MENLLQFDMASGIARHKELITIFRDWGCELRDPIEDLLAFDQAFTDSLPSHSRAAKIDSGEPIVGSLNDHTASYGWANFFFYNPYSEWINVLLVPALVWASTIAVIGGPWEIIVFTIKNGVTFDTTYSDYVLLQIKAMFWGPIQVLTYLFRAITFIVLIPWNVGVFLANMLFIPATFFLWFVYFLKAWLWWIDAAYVLSKAWINSPIEYITRFMFLITDYYLSTDLVFFWFWIPAYYLASLYEWLWNDVFESRPTKDSLFEVYYGESYADAIADDE